MSGKCSAIHAEAGIMAIILRKVVSLVHVRLILLNDVYGQWSTPYSRISLSGRIHHKVYHQAITVAERYKIFITGYEGTSATGPSIRSDVVVLYVTVLPYGAVIFGIFTEKRNQMRTDKAGRFYI